MLEKPVSELTFVHSKEPLPTVEVDIDSIPGSYYGYDDIVAEALGPFATSNPTVRATIYTYQGPSTSFREQTFSAFFGVAGSKTILPVLLAAFRNVTGVRARNSDYIAASSGIQEFHIEDGIVWRPSDALSWYTKEPGQAAPESENSDWEDAPLTDELNAGEPEAISSETEPTSSKAAMGSRYRQARSDASVASIKRTIEKVFGLPEGSVALCGPDYKPLRANAKISTLRKRWE